MFRPLLVSATLLALGGCAGSRGSDAQDRPAGHTPPPGAGAPDPVPPEGARFHFEVEPYLQLGPAPDAFDRLNLLWHTQPGTSGWAVEVKALPSGTWHRVEAPSSSPVKVPRTGLPDHCVWTAVLAPLPPGGSFDYRLLKDEKVVFLQQGVQARKPAGSPQRIVVVGDLVERHSPGGLAIARQIHAQSPDLVVAAGDLVYEQGRVHEYRNLFFPTYNAAPASAKGVPLLRSTLMVGVLGNHDVNHVGRTQVPPLDGLAYYYYWDQPLNGPELAPGGHVPNLTPSAAWADFHRAAGERFPRMGSFTFRSGDAHWTVLDSNPYVHWTEPRLQAWLDRELQAASSATWRFVVFHHPAFNLAATTHSMGAQYHMRALWPLFQRHQVDLVFTGHLHTYQRTTPLRVTPTPPGVTDAQHCADEANLLPDRTFDGLHQTRAQGPIHVLTGGGGGPIITFPPPARKKAYHGQLVTGAHCFSLLEIEGKKLTFKQLDEHGAQLDGFTLTR